MNLKLLLLGLMLCINLTNVDSTIEKDNFDFFEMWSKVGSMLTEHLPDDSLKAANTVLDALGKAIPYAGPLAVLVFRLLGVQSEFGQMKDKLENMNNILNQLDDRFSEVLDKLEAVQIIAGYKAKIEQINNLKHAYERFTGNPTNDTRDDFKAECGSNKMMAFARWIEKELNAETHLPLRKVMLQDFDMRNFNYWSNQIAALLSNAIFLHSTCLGVSGYNATIINETLYGRNGYGMGDIEIFKKVLKNVKKGFNQGVKFIKRAFFSHARQEVRNFMVNYQDLEHREFSDKLYQMLSKKYYWRLWGVASSKTYIIFRNKDKELFKANRWFWDGKRTLIVGSVLPDKSNKTYTKVEEYIERCPKASKLNSFSISDVDSVEAILSLCNIKTLRIFIRSKFQVYKTISTEWSGFYQRGVYNPRTFNGNVYNVSIDAHVISIPRDSSATITDGEVCSASGAFCSGDNHCCPKGEETNEFFCCHDSYSCAEKRCA